MSFPQLLISALIVALLLWRLQLRWKANIGRQPLLPKRHVILLLIFVAAAAAMSALSIPHWSAVRALGWGVLLGALLSLIGLRLTRFEHTPQGEFFTPNPHLGIALTLLLAGQFIYRKVIMYLDAHSTGISPSIFDHQSVFVLLGMNAGYFIGYHAGVLIRGKRS